MAKPKATKSRPRAAANNGKSAKAQVAAKKAKSATKATKAAAKTKAAKTKATKTKAAKTKAAKTKAAKTKATKTKAAKPTKATPAKAKSKDPIARAIAGDLDALFAAADTVERGQRDLMLYRWLAIAADFGSKKADRAMDDMLEVSDLRHDDDHGAQGDAHFELAISYLTGSDGLPRHLEHARDHLLHARRCDYPEQIQEGARFVADARKRLDAEARVVFDAVYNGQPLSAQDDDDDGDDDDDDYGD